MNRETLYEQVWAAPMVKVAARHGVSSSYLARVCERLHVPRPPRGYWAQLEVGKAPPKPALPEARAGDELWWSRDDDPKPLRREPPKPPRENRGAPPPRATTKQPKRHPLLVDARKHFDGVRESENGYLRPAKRKLVDVFVSKQTLDRALSFANRLFREFEARGYRVTFPSVDQHLSRPAMDERSKGGGDRYEHGIWRPDRPTIVFIGSVAIGLTIVELSEEVEVQYVDGKYLRVKQVPIEKRHRFSTGYTWTTKRDLPTGRLCLRASSPYAVAKWERHWSEVRKGELGPRVHEIVAALEAAAVTLSQLVEEGEQRVEEQRREWQLQMEKWEREEAERRRVQHAKESRDELSAIVAAWGVAKNIEAFFGDVERRSQALSEDERATILERLHHARALLGGIDALQRFMSWRGPEER